MSTPFEPRTARTDLLLAARTAAGRAYAPYSNFLVGAALLDSAGNIWVGCNVETSAATGLHAEDGAIGAWRVGDGAPVVAIVIYSADSGDTAPCGKCRQLLAEMCPEAMILTSSGSIAVKELLPGMFHTNWPA